jgi:hypothetical protein
MNNLLVFIEETIKELNEEPIELSETERDMIFAGIDEYYSQSHTDGDGNIWFN